MSWLARLWKREAAAAASAPCTAPTGATADASGASGDLSAVRYRHRYAHRQLTCLAYFFARAYVPWLCCCLLLQTAQVCKIWKTIHRRLRRRRIRRRCRKRRCPTTPSATRRGRGTSSTSLTLRYVPCQLLASLSPSSRLSLPMTPVMLLPQLWASETGHSIDFCDGVSEGKDVRYPMILGADGEARVDLGNEFLLWYSQQPKLQQEPRCNQCRTGDSGPTQAPEAECPVSPHQPGLSPQSQARPQSRRSVRLVVA